jgi:uncharacterized protein (UPF0147 family)
VEIDGKLKAAMSAGGEELWKLIREHHSGIIANAVLNRNLTEDMAVFIGRKKGTPSEALEVLAGDVRFKESYTLKMALCRNPKTPQKTTFSLLKFLRIFDLSDLTKEQTIPLNVRQKIEQMIAEKIPSMPSGVKSALARRANSAIVTLLLEQGEENVISACLDSPVLTEGFLYKVINKDARPLLVRMVAEHRKWSLRYAIRFALIRNFNTPMVHVTDFIGRMKTADLKDLYADPKLPASTRPFIFSELLQRNEGTDAAKEEVYTLSEEEE